MTTEVVETLEGAKVGDTVWLFDSQASNYVGGVYKGRGVWKKTVIEEENRVSFIIGRQKYDKKTGVCRPTSGYSPQLFLFGELERSERVWRGYSWQIAEAVKRCDDVEKLKQIATIVGWQP